MKRTGSRKWRRGRVEASLPSPSTRYPGILSHSIIGTRTRGVIEFIINFRGTAISRGNGGPPADVASDSDPFSTVGDSISISSRPEVSREWLLSHFRAKKESNEGTMEAGGYWEPAGGVRVMY